MTDYKPKIHLNAALLQVRDIERLMRHDLSNAAVMAEINACVALIKDSIAAAKEGLERS